MLNKCVIAVLCSLLFSVVAEAKTTGNQTASSGAKIDYSFAKELDIPTGTIANITASPSVGAIYHATDGSTTGDCSVGGGTASALCIYKSTGWIAVDTKITQAIELLFTPNGDISSTNTQAAITEVRTDAATPRNNLITLTGVDANSTNMGVFIGTTISDNKNIKEVLGELETAVEVRNTSPTGINIFTADDCLLVSGMVEGDLCFEY